MNIPDFQEHNVIMSALVFPKFKNMRTNKNCLAMLTFLSDDKKKLSKY